MWIQGRLCSPFSPSGQVVLSHLLLLPAAHHLVAYAGEQHLAQQFPGGLYQGADQYLSPGPAKKYF